MNRRPARSYLGITMGRWTPLRAIAMPERDVRRAVMKYNDNFGNNGQNTYILHSVKGYRMTDDLAEIDASIEHDLNQYKKCLSRLNHRKKSIRTIHNVRMDLE